MSKWRNYNYKNNRVIGIRNVLIMTAATVFEKRSKVFILLLHCNFLDNQKALRKSGIDNRVGGL